ncbi:unnamed protein product [Protopolystoma xenopodis]|uniref:Uncharacterized protein n=1 Tax=Protopolystoma xenopodis TaxID=117903 RepID=A0A448XR73_9PLAT|nr:unnamed protein product [Protopolystoma xenopodis]
MLPRSDNVRHMTDESFAPFHRNRRRLPRKQRQHESSSKANRQLVKRNPLSPFGGTDLRISSPNTFTRNGSRLNNYETRDSSKSNISSHLSQSLSCPVRSFCSLPGSSFSLDPCHPSCTTRGVIRPPLRLDDKFEAKASA